MWDKPGWTQWNVFACFVCLFAGLHRAFSIVLYVMNLHQEGVLNSFSQIYFTNKLFTFIILFDFLQNIHKGLLGNWDPGVYGLSCVSLGVSSLYGGIHTASLNSTRTNATSGCRSHTKEIQGLLIVDYFLQTIPEKVTSGNCSEVPGKADLSGCWNYQGQRIRSQKVSKDSRGGWAESSMARQQGIQWLAGCHGVK